MKTNIEYSDPYRFLVSAGIVLIGLSLLLPWLLLQVSLDIVISTIDLAQLTPAAQDIVYRRQASALWLIDNVGPISGVFACLGILCLVFGLLFWYRRYHQQEELEIMEEQNRKLEAQRAAPNAYNSTLANARRELALENQTAKPIPSDKAYSEGQSLIWWINLFNDVHNIMEKRFSRTHQLDQAFEVNGDNYFFLKARQSDNPDVLLKLRPVQERQGIEWLLDHIARTELSHLLLKGRNPIAISSLTLFVVRDDSVLPSEEVKDSIDQALKQMRYTSRWDAITSWDQLDLKWYPWQEKLFPQGLKEPLSQRAEGAVKANQGHIIWLLLFGLGYTIIAWGIAVLIANLLNYHFHWLGISLIVIVGLLLAFSGLYLRILLDGGGLLEFTTINQLDGVRSLILSFPVGDGPLIHPIRQSQLFFLGIKQITLDPLRRGVIVLNIKMREGYHQKFILERNSGAPVNVDLPGWEWLEVTYRTPGWLRW